MIGVLELLQPRAEKKGVLIYGALQATDEMYFIMGGAVDVGFEVNKTNKYCLRLKKGNVIGAYNCTFEQKTLYSYVVKYDVKAYVIRKTQWRSLIQDK